jgi:hypothetical protein
MLCYAVFILWKILFKIDLFVNIFYIKCDNFKQGVLLEKCVTTIKAFGFELQLIICYCKLL